MSRSSPDRPRQPRSRLSVRACELASQFGVWLLPLFYVAYFIALALACRAPSAEAWLPAAGTALAVSMGLWAVVFHLASRLPDEPARSRADLPPPAARRPARARVQAFGHMPTRPCIQACHTPSGAAAQFTIACYKADCAAAQRPAEAPVVFHPRRNRDAA